jgi:hypothetical protein
MWLVPARDFNRLAYRRQHGSRIELRFKTPAEDHRWNRLSVNRDDLAARIAALMGAAPGEKAILAPANSLCVRLVGPAGRLLAFKKAA